MPQNQDMQTYTCVSCKKTKTAGVIKLSFDTESGIPIRQVTIREIEPGEGGPPNGGWTHGFLPTIRDGRPMMDEKGKIVLKPASMCHTCTQARDPKGSGLLWTPRH